MSRYQCSMNLTFLTEVGYEYINSTKFCRIRILKILISRQFIKYELFVPGNLTLISNSQTLYLIGLTMSASSTSSIWPIWSLLSRWYTWFTWSISSTWWPRVTWSNGQQFEESHYVQHGQNCPHCPHDHPTRPTLFS